VGWGQRCEGIRAAGLCDLRAAPAPQPGQHVLDCGPAAWRTGPGWLLACAQLQDRLTAGRGPGSKAGRCALLVTPSEAHSLDLISTAAAERLRDPRTVPVLYDGERRIGGGERRPDRMVKTRWPAPGLTVPDRNLPWLPRPSSLASLGRGRAAGAATIGVRCASPHRPAIPRLIAEAFGVLATEATPLSKMGPWVCAPNSAWRCCAVPT